MATDTIERNELTVPSLGGIPASRPLTLDPASLAFAFDTAHGFERIPDAAELYAEDEPVPAGVRQPATAEEADAVIRAEFPDLKFCLSEITFVTRTGWNDGVSRECEARVYRRAGLDRFNADNWPDVVAMVRAAERGRP